MEQLKSLFERNEYTPLNNVLLSSDKLISNIKYLQSINPNLDLFPNLKANAYGHGIIQIASALKNLNLKYIVVDSLFEAYEIYKSGLDIPILIAGYVIPENLKVKPLPFSYAVWDADQIEKILSYQPNAKLHLFIDSGMNREGVRLEQLKDLLERIKRYNQSFEGTMSHFASSDDLSSNQSSKQVQTFNEAIKLCEASGLVFKFKHVSNSAGVLFQNNLNYNAARIGLATYGLNPVKVDTNLKPILTLKTHIAQIKIIRKGDSIGYNATYTAPKDMKIGILPIGYSDGIDRRLSNKGVVKIENTFCPIIGRISMNITTIDLTSIPDVVVGKEVTIFSDNNNEPNSVENVAKICDTISYTILVGINPFMRRTIV